MITEITEFTEGMLDELVELGRRSLEAKDAEYRRQVEEEEREAEARRGFIELEVKKLRDATGQPLFSKALWPFIAMRKCFMQGSNEIAMFAIEAPGFAPIVFKVLVHEGLNNELLLKLVRNEAWTFQVMGFEPAVDLEYEPGYYTREVRQSSFDDLNEALYAARQLGNQREAVLAQAQEMAEKRRLYVESQMKDEDAQVEEQLSLLTKAEGLLDIDGRADGALLAAVRAIAYVMLYQARV